MNKTKLSFRKNVYPDTLCLVEGVRWYVDKKGEEKVLSTFDVWDRSAMAQKINTFRSAYPGGKVYVEIGGNEYPFTWKRAAQILKP